MVCVSVCMMYDIRLLYGVWWVVYECLKLVRMCYNIDSDMVVCSVFVVVYL